MDNVNLIIDGQIYSNWTSASITRDMKTAEDTFDLELLVNRNQILPSIFKPFGYQQCQIAIDQDLIITGIIDVIQRTLSRDSLKLKVIGRSNAGQLVDCSMTERPFEFNNLTLENIATKLAAPFGIKAVFPDGHGASFKKVQVDHGETIYSFLTKLAVQRAFFISSTSLGNIVFWRAATSLPPVDALFEGQNPLVEIQSTFNGQIRFSDITVESQKKGGESPAQGKAIDSIVQEANIFRPLLVKPTEVPDGLDLDDVAKWERGKRNSESMPMTATVLGWRKTDLSPWRENENITVLAPSVDFKTQTTMLLESLTYSINASGKLTTLNLVLPNANSLNDEVVRPWLV